MGTAAENRLQWLAHLVHKHGGMAALNRALGRAERDATLSQILHKAPNSKTGAPRKMGDKMARGIEAALGLEHGSLDRERTTAPAVPAAMNDTQALTELERAALSALRGLTRDQQRDVIVAMERTRDLNLRIVGELSAKDVQAVPYATQDIQPARRAQPELRPYPSAEQSLPARPLASPQKISKRAS